MAGGCREWVRANDALRVGNNESSYFLSPRPIWRPLSNKQNDETFKEYVQFLCNFCMSNLFYSVFRPRFDLILTLHASIKSGSIVLQRAFVQGQKI